MRDTSPLTLLALAWTAAAGGMAGAWAMHLRARNATVVDAAWTFEVGGLGVLYALVGNGWTARRLLIGVLMSLWSLRLGGFIVRDRLMGQPEDARYQTLRQQWRERAALRFFWFFQAQALAAVLFSLPALLIAQHAHPAWRAVEVAGVGLWALAFAGEAAADSQLRRFKRDPRNRGRTCREGLWRWSRHPNYFFEWTVWVALALIALPGPYGFVAIACPAVMLYLLLRVTGIPATEAQALRSRGEDYRQYQSVTSRFIPWRPR